MKKVEENIAPKESTYNKMTTASKYRLGIRNTFNIFTKFVLCFVVFLFISAAVLAEYASFQSSEYEWAQTVYRTIFYDLSDNRIFIKKQDKTEFTEDDYNKIRNIENVEKIVKHDFFLDKSITLSYEKEENKNENELGYANYYLSDGNIISINGYLRNIEDFDGTVDEGRLPQDENEVVVVRDPHLRELHNQEDFLNKEFVINTAMIQSLTGKDYNSNRLANKVAIKKVKVVGIKYLKRDNYSYDNNEIYASAQVIDYAATKLNEYFSNLSYEFNGKIVSNGVIIAPSKKVEKGKAIVNDSLKYELTRGSIKDKTITIHNDNLYYDLDLTLSISGTYTEKNFESVTGFAKDYYGKIIFINEEDYISLYNKGPYQSSVYLKNTKSMDKTIKELEDIGINTKKILDYKVQSNLELLQVMKVLKLIVTIILIFVLFFISYFIIRIILKSRNVYYTTLRMLGATLRNVKRLLDIELFVNSSLAYGILVFVINLIKNNIIHFEYVRKLAEFLTLREYVLLYIVIVLMSRLISRRFSKKLFKNTAISTYNEEV